MKHASAKKSCQVALLLCLLAVTVSWQSQKKPHRSEANRTQANPGDTTTPRTRHSAEIDFQLNLDSVMHEVDLALSGIDYEKINTDVQDALSKVDYNKINREIDQAMKRIDWKQMNVDISRAMDSAKLAMDKIDWKKIRADIDKAREEIKKQPELYKINTDSIRMQIQRSLRDAQDSL